MTSSPILELRHVSASYGAIEVLHDIDISVAKGEVVALLGPNGAGKTTAIKVACGLMRPSSGSLHIAGQDVTGVPANALARVGVCTIPEGRGIFPNLSVRDNIVMAARDRASIAVIEERSYSRFPILKERRDQLAGTLSGGQQQMLSLARGLATDPVVLMLDEMSMGLAPLVVAELYEQVTAIAESGVSVLVVEQFARTVLGVADSAEQQAFGVERGERAKMFDEALEVMRKCWLDDEVNHDGQWFKLNGLRVEPKPKQQPPDVWLGGIAPSELKRVARLSDGWLPSFVMPDEAGAGWETITSHAASLGRSIEDEHFGVLIPYRFGPLPDALSAGLAARRPDLADPGVLIPNGWDELVTRIREFIAVGASKFVVLPLVEPAGSDAWISHLEEAADVVIPLQT